MKTLAAVAVAALILTACMSGPGNQCDPACAEAEAKVPCAGKDSQAAAAAAASGQDTTGEQSMQDIVPAKPSVTWGRGEGAVSSQNEWVEHRSQSGAPVVSQGLLFPANASAENNLVSGIPPLVAALQTQIAKTNAQLDVAVATGNLHLSEQLRTDLKSLFEQMHTATMDTSKTVNHNYNFEGSTINQGVASSSGANADPAATKANDEGASTSDASSVPSVLKSSGVIPGGPDCLPKPPAGVVPEKPAGSGGGE